MKSIRRPQSKNQRGMIAVVLLFAVTGVALALTATMAALAIGDLRMSQSGSASLEQTFYDADSGLNVALYRLIGDPVPGNYDFHYGSADIEVSVTADPLDPYRRYVRARADDNGRIRTVQVTATTDAYSNGFDSAVNAGTGGLIMENNSCVIGNILSNGPVIGPGANDNGCNVTSYCRPAYGEKDSVIPKDADHDGEVTLTGATYSVSGVRNTGDIVAHNITDSIAGKFAKYRTLAGTVKANGGSETCGSSPGTYCVPDSPDQAAAALPVTQAIVDTWKSEITGVADETPSLCPPGYDTGYFCVTSDTTLGNVKIVGSTGDPVGLYVKGGVTLTLSGNIWVTGDITFDNNGSNGLVRVDPSLGGESVVIISDSNVNVDNNFQINGSGDPRSFVLLVSMSDSVDDSDPAIDANNNSNSIVFAALNGLLEVKNNGCLNASVTHQIHLMPGSTVNFNSNLSVFTVSGGGGNQVGTALGSWQEL